MNYRDLLYKVYHEGVEEMNQRTGIKTRRLFEQVVELKASEGNIFCPRKISPMVAAAEVAWMIMGDKSTGFLSKYTSIWKKFEDDNRPGYVSTAYGFRWRYAFGRNQLREAINLLQKDPSTRQALVLSWDPHIDGLMNQGSQKNVPCPFAFSLYIREGKGHMTVYQRSADIIVGIPYDLMSYYLLGQAIFNEVMVPFDGVGIMIGDAHIYENFYGVAKEMLDTLCPKFPHGLDHGWKAYIIDLEPDSFVECFRGIYSDAEFLMDKKLEAAQ